jgi:hypothetical protein
MRNHTFIKCDLTGPELVSHFLTLLSELQVLALEVRTPPRSRHNVFQVRRLARNAAKVLRDLEKLSASNLL